MGTNTELSRIRLSGRGIEMTSELRAFVQRRVGFALGRFAGRIRSLSVRLGDINGPRGGVDKSCDICIDAGRAGRLLVSERRANIHAAVAEAADRAGRAIVRQLTFDRTAAKKSRRLQAESEAGRQPKRRTDQVAELREVVDSCLAQVN